MMSLIRSLLHMAWMVVTVVPWTLAVWVASLGSRTAAWWTAVNWFSVVMWGTRHFLGVRFEVQGYANLPVGKTSAAVLLCNHQSTLETLLLPTLMPHPLAFVFKRELLMVPFFGWSMARMDMIHIDRESRTEAMKHVIEQGCRLLAHGTWVIMFPEGTRITRGQDGFVKPGGVATVSIGPLIDSKGRDPKALMREAEAWIEAELRRIDPEAYLSTDLPA